MGGVGVYVSFAAKMKTGRVGEVVRQRDYNLLFVTRSEQKQSQQQLCVSFEIENAVKLLLIGESSTL